jgi:tetratricopeptide (TPR) repeat protein
MSQHKIAITTISLNEEKFAQRFMDAHKNEVDAIYVLDTGSNDRTVEILRDNGAHVVTGWTKPWRFDIPRNAAINLVPAEYKICISVDLDEVFNPGLREGIYAAWMPDTTRLRYQYAWSVNEDGTPGTTFWYDKIFHRDHYRWVLPVHEVLCYSSPSGHEIQAWSNDIFLTHKPDPTKSRGSYLPLLELAHRENENDDRTAHYLGREYMFYGKWDEAISQLTRHISMPSATWKSERCASMRFIGRSYQGKGDLASAEQWYLKACAEMPSEREPWYELAKNYHLQRNWHGLYFAAKNTLAIKERPASYICEPAAWNWEPYDLASLGAWNIGLKEESLVLANQALELNPSDGRLKSNVEIISKMLQK